ncbi:DUF4446 family protein [Clostridium fermenticellae]|uniref:DUF4446 family protein n=1 Tax=Clostridium fermenticellae TaxID=2068654 RepID=A0A386H6I0_9CLOT|nr:DUF4446 family protein [Clostridium fermenticellae]AYD41371.1 DUF4446 family protein [Clostridium fermenticellae]
MQNIVQLINNFQVYILLGFLVLILILFILLITTNRSLNRLEKKYKRLMRGVNSTDLEELINSYLNKIDKTQENYKYMKDLYENLNKKFKKCIQKYSIIRYRAFEDVGSDLSFSIALLDENNDGIIITGIYGRNQSTTYAKPIDKGMSRYELSDEEKHVLNNCINN